MTIEYYESSINANATVIIDADSIDNFKELVRRAMNLWPDAPPELKEFTDLLLEGKVLQDYRRQDTSGPGPAKYAHYHRCKQCGYVTAIWTIDAEAPPYLIRCENDKIPIETPATAEMEAGVKYVNCGAMLPFCSYKGEQELPPIAAWPFPTDPARRPPAKRS